MCVTGLLVCRLVFGGGFLVLGLLWSLSSRCGRCVDCFARGGRVYRVCSVESVLGLKSLQLSRVRWASVRWDAMVVGLALSVGRVPSWVAQRTMEAFPCGQLM